MYYNHFSTTSLTRPNDFATSAAIKFSTTIAHIFVARVGLRAQLAAQHLLRSKNLPNVAEDVTPAVQAIEYLQRLATAGSACLKAACHHLPPLIATSMQEKLVATMRAVGYSPVCDNIISPIVYALPMQLLAYHVAVFKGTDVDQPRNLAKSVTVE